MVNNNRKQNNRSILALAALQVMPLSIFAQNAGDRPNILYIMCDDHAMQAISAYGSPISKLAPTPNIDRLAERGMKFNEAFVENSLSTPSRACLMTGLYSHQNGQRQLARVSTLPRPSSQNCCRGQAILLPLWASGTCPAVRRDSTTIMYWTTRGSTTTLPSLLPDSMVTSNRRWDMLPI